MEITIRRHFDIIHSFAKYKVYADSEFIGEIANGETARYIIPDDTKHIYLASKRYYSPKVSCEVIKNRDYEVGSGQLPKIAFLFLLLFGFFLVLDAYIHINFKYYGGLLILSLFLILYSRINGVDKYIRFTDHISIKNRDVISKIEKNHSY